MTPSTMQHAPCTMHRVEELVHQDRMPFHIYLYNQNGDPFCENIQPDYKLV